MQHNWLEYQAKNNPDKCAVIFRGDSISFLELYRRAAGLAARMNALGRERIGLYVENTLESVCVVHAAMLANIESVMINTRLTGKEISRQLEDIDVDTVIATRDFSLEGYRVIQYEALEQLEPGSSEQLPAEEGDILSIMFTSGTTGRAKAVAQSYGNHHASAAGCRHSFGYDEDSVWMNINPIYHISGFSIILRTVITGCTMVLVEKFEEESVWAGIVDHSVTHTSMVPIMLQRLIERDIPEHRLEGILLGGAGVTKALLKSAIDRQLPVYNSFGMTETCSQIVSIGPDDPRLLTGTVGRPLANISIRIDRDNDDELLVRGGAVTKGYLNADMERDDDYFRTGDMGHVDEAGYLYILDRRKDLIISGGENIYPKEIEDVVNAFDSVQNSVVVKRRDDRWGEVPVLLVEEKQGHTLDRGSLTVHMERNLARYKLPKEVHFVESIWMTSTGKVSRALNQKAYEERRSSTP